MSAQVLSDLFQQIVHSEEKIKQRFDALKKVNQDIQEFQEKIRNIKYENQSLISNIEVVNHKVVHEEIEWKWLEMREDILKQQREESKRQKNTILNEINKSEELEENKRVLFLSQCDKFLRHFDVLKNNMEGEHEEAMRKKLKVLIEEDALLTHDVQCVRKEKKATAEMMNDKEQLVKNIDCEKRKKKDINCLLNKLKKERKHLLTSKDNLMKSFNHDPECRRLTCALDESKSSCITLSEQYQVLAKQLHQRQSVKNKIHHRQSHVASNPWSIKPASSSIAHNNDLNNGVAPMHKKKRFNYQGKRKESDLNENGIQDCFTDIQVDSFDCFTDIEADSFDFGFEDQLIPSDDVSKK